jgi:carbon-monoxide dehydrogenase medium subunit
MPHAGTRAQSPQSVKPPPFGYQPATSVAEAVDVLAAEGNDAAVLAGGQSLLIDLRYRRVRPRLLLDINRVAGLAGVEGDETAVRIGALVRHRQLERLPLADPLAVLLARAARHVAHPPVRTRGTLAGSVAWAHPAAEWCAITAGLAGTVETASTAGTRLVPAADWFTGRHRTSRRPDELVTAVWLPRLGPGAGVGFAEHRRTHGSFALAAAAAVVRVSGGRVSWARIGLANAGETPLRAVPAERVLTGQPVSAGLLAAAAERAAADAQPVPEPYCEPDYRRQVLRVLVRRSLEQAVGHSLEQAAGHSLEQAADGRDEEGAAG